MCNKTRLQTIGLVLLFYLLVHDLEYVSAYSLNQTLCKKLLFLVSVKFWELFLLHFRFKASTSIISPFKYCLKVLHKKCFVWNNLINMAIYSWELILWYVILVSWSATWTTTFVVVFLMIFEMLFKSDLIFSFEFYSPIWVD